jgi:hypothetical protein
MLRSYWLVPRMRSPLSSSVSLPATPTGHMTPEQSGSPVSGSPGAYRRPLPATPTGHVTPGTSRRPLPPLARSAPTPPASQATRTEVLLVYYTPSDEILSFTLTFEKGLKASNLTSNTIRYLKMSMTVIWGKTMFR